MENTNAHRRELAEFLRARRERLTPEEVGIDTAGECRRTPGLRRSEVSRRAGVSVTWYTWLEQARRIRVSPQVLTSLARALQLSRAETEHLFELAGELAPARSGARPEKSRVDGDVCRHLMDRLNPAPAAMLSRCWDIVKANDAFRDLLPLAAGRRGVPNLLAAMFEPEARMLFVDWQREAASTVARFRAWIGRDIVRLEVAELVESLTRAEVDFRSMWHQREVVVQPLTRFRINHPRLGRIDLLGVSFALIGSDETLLILTPVTPEVQEPLVDPLRQLQLPAHEQIAVQVPVHVPAQTPVAARAGADLSMAGASRTPALR